ncbi:MAG: M13 family metallopeptidase [Lachnospiraceae bacterium]|nr:M13 family metallopeptidase [Lachnospiraceae bacterium]
MEKKYLVIKKVIALYLLTAVMAVSITACGRGKVSEIPGHGFWVDSDIAGTVKAEDNIRLQDDFAAAANKDFLVSTVFDPDKGAMGPFYDTQAFIYSRYREAIHDENISDENINVLRKYEELVLDWDSRNALGLEPLRAYIDDICNISDIDEFTAYQGSLTRNPFNIGLYMSAVVQGQIKLVDKSILTLKKPSYSMGESSYYVSFDANALEKKEKVYETVDYFLTRLAFDKEEIKEILEANFRLETFLARHECESKFSEYEATEEAQCDREGLKEYCKGYPLLDILDSRGFGECKSFYVDYPYVGALNSIYNDAHLKELKAFLIVQTIAASQYLLDREAYDKVLEIGLSRKEEGAHVIYPEDDELFASSLKLAGLIPAMDTVYLKKYYSDGSKIKMVSDFIDGLIVSYRKMINEEEWLTDESRAKAIEKLDNMIIHVVKPDNMADYSGADIKSYSEGGNLLDAAAAGNIVLNKYIAKISAVSDLDRSYWDIYDTDCSTTEVNCFYMPSKNCFYILAGWTTLAEYIYGEDFTFEEFAGCVGTVAGHEISHGFDANGSLYDLYGRQYDDDGNKADWMSSEDRSRLDERANVLANYFSLIRPIPGQTRVIGSAVSDEAIADMGGLKAVLYMVKDMPDFNYDKFFRAYAALWAELTTKENDLNLMEYDEHPLNYLRINVNLQQFDEFIDTYNIQPGDGMYLEPKRRVNVW